MTPKEKAAELYQKYFSMITIKSPIDKNASIPYVKKCVLIVINEIILEREVIFAARDIPTGTFWHEVKAEIEAL